MSAGAPPAAAAVLDNRRAPCAVGLIRAAVRMRDVAPGEAIQIWSRDHFAPMEIPLWAQREGYTVTPLPRRGVWPWRHHVFVVGRPA